MDNPSFPKLRWPLDVQRLSIEGNEAIMLRDPEGVAPEAIYFPILFAPVLAKLDGNHSVEEVALQCSRLGVTVDLVKELVAELDSFFLLDSARGRERRDSLLRNFHESPVRPAVFAGRLYPDDAAELKQTITDFCARASHPALNGALQRPVRAMITPHIDYRRGWKSYAASQTILDAIPRPDVIFLFGTAHQASRGMFHLTQKNFTGPFGEFPTAKTLVSQIANRLGEKRCFDQQILHRTEHSLELQLPFLAHRFSGEGLPEIVPILVGSFYHLLQRQGAADSELDDFIGTVAELLRSLDGKRVLLYGGVDLAHVGRSFGDTGPLNDEALAEIEERDREFLDAALAGDPQAVFAHVASDMDKRRLCGFPSIYTMLAVMRAAGLPSTGKLIEYRQAFDQPSDCLVSFASAYWCAR